MIRQFYCLFSLCKCLFHASNKLPDGILIDIYLQNKFSSKFTVDCDFVFLSYAQVLLVKLLHLCRQATFKKYIRTQTL